LSPIATVIFDGLNASVPLAPTVTVWVVCAAEDAAKAKRVATKEKCIFSRCFVEVGRIEGV